MKRLVRSRASALVGMVGITLVAVPLLAQDEPKPAPFETPKPIVRTYNPARRVPPYFGQIGLTIEQRETIYEIRGGYYEKIAALKKQIEDLTAEEMRECEAVLTEAQLKLLEQRRAARKGGATSKGVGGFDD